MGSTINSSSFRSSDEISFTDSDKSTKRKNSWRLSEIVQEDLQISRKRMVDTWKNTMIKTLKRKAATHNQSLNTCQRIISAINQTPTSSYWKVFQIIDSMTSQQIIQCKYNQLTNKQQKPRKLQRANSIIIDIKSLGKKISLKDNQKYLQNQSEESKINHHIKNCISTILQNEFQQSYHPFSLIKQILIQDLCSKYKNMVISNKPQENTQIILELTKDMKAIITFFVKSSQVYKSWISDQTNLKQKGYLRFISKVAVNSLFHTPSNLHSILTSIIKKSNINYIQSTKTNLKQNANINQFSIKKQLQIQGNYIKSMLMLSEIDKIVNPKEMIKFFELLKDQIQYDIEFFNETFSKAQNTVIDGDNLLSILCYMMCKMKAKLGDIHSQLTLLQIVYGDSIMTEYDQASYIIAAMMAAIDYLRSEQFIDHLNK